jgi:organic radical activating enzyme
VKALPVLNEPVLTAGPAAPPWPHQPTVEWQICGACNYDCSYCIQSRASRVGFPTAAEIDRALAFLAGLPGAWEIKMTGGEPFVSRLFLDRIVPGLMATRHRVSVLTNLSAPPASLARFAALTHGRLGVVSASLHLEHTTVPAFLLRLRGLQAATSGARFVVNSVLDPQRLPEVRAARDAVQAAGFSFFPQLMKVKQGVYAYSPQQLRQVDEIVGGLAAAAEARSANLAPAYTGRRCWTGARYLVLLQNGDAWSCRSARRQGQGFLGNVHADGVQLRPGPVSCPYTICPCAVPANRGMIEGVPPRGLEAEA